MLLCGAISIQKSVSAEVVDTLTRYQLQDVEVKGKKLRSPLSDVDGVSIVDMSLMEHMPQILGNADPIHYAQLLPGIQTNSEYDAGLHIQGCDNAHNYVSLGGVPIYNASHLLGFFSIFNASHFSKMKLQKSSASAALPNRLGGMVDMTTPTWICGDDSLADKYTHGDLSVGPMSSQATLKIPIGKKSLLMLSGRAAYLNLLYSKWLEVDGDKVSYDFSDYNMTFVTQLNSHNVIKAEAYWGYDNFKLGMNTDGMNSKIKWDNTMAALHWYFNNNKWQTEQTFYYTRYANKLTLNELSVDVDANSFIYDIGYKAIAKTDRWNCGIDIAQHCILPQRIRVGGAFNSSLPSVGNQRSTEASAHANYSQPLLRNLALVAGLRLSAYRYKSYFYGIDPSIQLNWNMSAESQMSLNVGLHHQYLYQNGFSSMGLPTEYWFSASKDFRPQYAYSSSLQTSFWLKDREYRISGEIYLKYLKHQAENSGNILDVVYSSYSLENALMKGMGYNYGANILLEKRRGRLTGWISYSYGRAKRKFDGDEFNRWYSANHERIHEMNIVATFRINKHWDIGATYVLASGTPYTRIKYAYLMSNNIVAEYEPHNADRVKPYMRLDLSINYDFINRATKRSGINLSLYNVSMHKNVLFYRIKMYKQQVRYASFSFLMPILPSISYYYKF